MYDIVFISYNEALADHNYKTLCERFPIAQRVQGVKGIHQAHIEAAKTSVTKMFWVVDADAQIVNDFNFDYDVDQYNTETDKLRKEDETFLTYILSTINTSALAIIWEKEETLAPPVNQVDHIEQEQEFIWYNLPVDNNNIQREGQEANPRLTYRSRRTEGCWRSTPV